MLVKNKNEMASFLADAMYSSYARYRAEQKYEPDTGLLKSYIIEAHSISESESHHDTIYKLLSELADTARLQVVESEDETLFVVSHGRDLYYFDVSDSRFWIIHTIAKSTQTDKLWNDLIRKSPYIDKAWLPTQMLERMTEYGHFRGFGAVHDETPFMKEAEEAEVETMHFRLWGGSAKAVLNSLKQSEAFPHSLALSSVRIKYWMPNLADEAVIDNFTFDGKVTALGKSFISHVNLLSRLHNYYADTIREIERTLPLQFVPENEVPTLHGFPIIITLSRKLENLHSFVTSIFSSTVPFRLWGMSELYDNNFARVYAVDLHTGHKLNFEIGLDFVRIYLPVGTCGNTIARFYTNLQQYYDSNASISGGTSGRLF
jgi:hypothetical protein